MFAELGYNIIPTTIAGDNQGSIFIATNPVQECRTKHIDICYHYIRQMVEDGKIKVEFIPGNDNPADMFTKNLGRIKFQKFIEHLGFDKISEKSA